MKGSPGHVVAACFGLTAFAIAIVAGLASDTPANSVLSRSVIAMILCYPVGLVVGMICDRVIQSHLSTLQAEADPEDGIGEVSQAEGANETEEITVV